MTQPTVRRARRARLLSPARGALRGTFVLALGIASCAAACVPFGEFSHAPAGNLEARARLRHRQPTLAPGPTPVAATMVYRGVLAPALGSRCRMFPTDSVAFDRRARDCGGLTAGILGIARLIEEVAATPSTFTPIMADGRLRYLDLPAEGRCWP